MESAVSGLDAPPPSDVHRCRLSCHCRRMFLTRAVDVAVGRSGGVGPAADASSSCRVKLELRLARVGGAGEPVIAAGVAAVLIVACAENFSSVWLQTWVPSE